MLAAMTGAAEGAAAAGDDAGASGRPSAGSEWLNPNEERPCAREALETLGSSVAECLGGSDREGDDGERPGKRLRLGRMTAAGVFLALSHPDKMSRGAGEDTGEGPAVMPAAPCTQSRLSCLEMQVRARM